MKEAIHRRAWRNFLGTHLLNAGKGVCLILGNDTEQLSASKFACFPHPMGGDRAQDHPSSSVPLANRYTRRQQVTEPAFTNIVSKLVLKISFSNQRRANI